MKDLALHDRPREKLARVGAAALGDNELLAVVLGSGGIRWSALQLANLVLESAGGLVGLTRAGHGQLQCLPGVGTARAAQILAAIELGRRTLVMRAPQRLRFRTPREIAVHLLPQFGARAVEQSGVVLLDPRQQLIRTTLLTVGTADASLVHPRDVFREAALADAASVVVFHNHPSGDPSPSPADAALTARLATAAALMGIELLDHIILADTRYYSFREMGVLEPPLR
jgi:DNA repair protein RadC